VNKVFDLGRVTVALKHLKAFKCNGFTFRSFPQFKPLSSVHCTVLSLVISVKKFGNTV